MKVPTAPQLLQRRSPRIADNATRTRSDSTRSDAATPDCPDFTEVRSELKLLEPLDPNQIVREDPSFRTWAAAEFLGMSAYCLEKWRQRDQGPDFLQYPDSSVRYPLSSLIRFRAAHRVVPSRQPRTQRSQ